ncbi:MAG: sterol-binding protein [Bacteroidetes bacterium]|nr:MAG: sterol-binding protein [Bacteroidota bacterium]TAG88839.1 MAG: sterol-binding protein [Bacteroidota bacterium]
MLADVTNSVIEKLKLMPSDLGATVKFVFPEGVIHVDGTNVTNEDKTADCSVAVELSDLKDMLSGELNPMQAFMGGKMKVDGDMSVAMKLQALFS